MTERLQITSMQGFGSDGASVMVGRKNGVAAKIKNTSLHCINIHCMAHRLNLCTSQASKYIPYMKQFEETLKDLYYFFEGTKSGNRQCELVEIQKILDDPKVKVRECHEIRWITFYEAVHAVFKIWTSLVIYFSRHTDQKSQSLHRRITEYKFVAILHMLLDILPSVAHMSLIFQKQDIDIAAVHPALADLKEKISSAKRNNSYYQREFMQRIVKKKDGDKVKEVTFRGQKLSIEDMKKLSRDIGDIRKEFCDTLHKNIENRFPKDCVDVAVAFNVLGLRPLSFLSAEDREDYGSKEMDILIKHYGSELKNGDTVSPAMIDVDQCRQEWAMVKRIVLEQQYPRNSLKILWKLLFQFHKDTLPNLLVLAELALIMPYQTADCERGFSCQNSIKTSKRNRMKDTQMNNLMTVKIEGPKLEIFDFAPVINLWKNKKERRIFKKT